MVSKELVSDLRHAFFEKLNKEGLQDDYFHKADIHKINGSNDWLARFLIHHDEQVPEALTMLWDTLIWRKENNVNDINESTVNLDFIKDGSMFLHGQDIDGKILLIFNCKMHIKGAKDWEENKKCIIYWFERAERFNNGDKMTIFFDMDGSGLANMDMDYTKYLIGLCKQYYPNFLNYIIIFQMPWVMNAAFKVIKSWLPAKAVEKIKFVNKSTLKDYVLPENALSCWGGEDSYQFVFEPEEPAVLDTSISMKRVHFEDGSPGDVRSTTSSSIHFMDENNHNSCVVTSLTKLRITPVFFVSFSRDKSGDVLGTITIANGNTRSVAFKIKTTSPEKFRVRPGSGILAPEDKMTVTVSIQEGVAPRDIMGDKFLVMSTLLEDQEQESSTDLVVLWKTISSNLVDQHRLKCSLNITDNLLAPSGGNDSTSNGSLWRGTSDVDSSVRGLMRSGNQMDSLYHAIQTLNEDNKVLKKQLKNHQYLLFLILSLMIVLIGIVMFMSLNPHENSPQEVTSPVCDIPSVPAHVEEL